MAAAEQGAAALEQFCLLAKSMKGRAVVGIIQQAISAKHVFVFGELLAMPTVQALRASEEHAPHYALLELFAYGTYAEYRAAAAGTYPAEPLKDEQLEKLRQLSIVSLARASSTVPYATLMTALDVAELRPLEDVVIETIYNGLLDARLDQKKACLIARRAASRDVRLSDVDGLIAKLKAFADASKQLSTSLGASVDQVRVSRDAHERRKTEVGASIEGVRKNLKEHLALGGAAGGDGAMAGFDGVSGGFDEMDIDKPRRGRGKRSRVPMFDRARQN